MSRNARAAHQAVLKADQVTFGRLEGLDEPFGVEPPALDVGAVERKEPPRLGHALLDERGELELVAGAGFVSRQRPGCRLEIKIIEFLHLSRGVGHVEWKDELADLASVAEEPGGLHVRRGGRRAFRLGRQPDLRGAIRQGQDSLRPDDVLDLLEPFLVVRRMASPKISRFLSALITSR